MKMPLIGITPMWDEKDGRVYIYTGYIRGLEKAGAAPVILPLGVPESVLKQIAEYCDGFLFSGGADLDPKYYGQAKAEHCGDVCEVRDKMEEYIFREGVLAQNKPALGICRGIQLFNAFLGGSLYQDLPTEFSSAINHRQKPPYSVPAHEIRLLPESPLGRLIGKERLEVNSHHHQAINALAEGFEVMAYADDGVVEAVYMPGRRYVWGVQWHPELMPNEDATAKIFASFVSSIERAA
ncbi:MAG: gamma-glutamyl-gamma-aminobutyrate hydrolase family protein [Treponema sp.]|jgi:putative glutamine amidotransferase|nr:gamma-glutamyl-gamma-aminobutyrate hydrolase family protein [Treponema sp.]